MSSSSAERGKSLAWASAAVGVLALAYLGARGLTQRSPDSLLVALGRPLAFAAIAYLAFRRVPTLRWVLVVWMASLAFPLLIGPVLPRAPTSSASEPFVVLGVLLAGAAATLALSRDVRQFIAAQAVARSQAPAPQPHNEEL